jgi:hypothetical protein
MRFQCLLCLLLATWAHGQASPSASSSIRATSPVPPNGATAETNYARTSHPSEVKVEPDDPVITLNGLCATRAQEGAACKTVITRAQFEKLADALQPGMSLSLRLNVASAYARNLRMAAVAEQRALDKTAGFEEALHYARIQLLAQDLTRALQAEANDIRDGVVEEYYKRNIAAFEEATVARIFVPHARQGAAAGEAGIVTSAGPGSGDEESMSRIAEDIRVRAVHGEDPDKLQIEAYAAAGVSRTTANTKLEKVRRTTLPPQHEAAMDLKVGDVSEVFSDPGGAHFIYKMISKRTLGLDEVKAEIRTALASQRYRDSMRSFETDNVFSDAYFVPPGSAASTPQRVRSGRKKRKPGSPEEARE